MCHPVVGGDGRIFPKADSHLVGKHPPGVYQRAPGILGQEETMWEGVGVEGE